MKPWLLAGAAFLASRSPCALLASCLALTAGTASAEECIASHYRHGHTIANGEAFDPDGPTCAHKSHPIGTMVRVTQLST